MSGSESERVKLQRQWNLQQEILLTPSKKHPPRPLGPTPACVAIVSCSLASKERGTRVKDRAKNGSRFISRAAKTENPVPRSSILAPFFARSLTLLPRSLLLNRTETLAKQARRISKLKNQFLSAQKPTSFRHYKTFLVKMNFLPSL